MTYRAPISDMLLSLNHGAGLKAAEYKFGHAAEHKLPGDVILLDSYHCSRYNTQTRRLTEEMFDAVFRRATALLASKP